LIVARWFVLFGAWEVFYSYGLEITNEEPRKVVNRGRKKVIEENLTR